MNLTGFRSRNRVANEVYGGECGALRVVVLCLAVCQAGLTFHLAGAAHGSRSRGVQRSVMDRVERLCTLQCLEREV